MISGLRACVFDAYGTLFDFASAAARADVPDDRRAALTALWRDKQLQYTWLRTLQGRYADFWQVTGDALDFALESCSLGDPALRAELMQLYLTLQPFPEVLGALAALKARGLTIAILSNGAPAMLASAVRSAGLGDRIDHAFSVDAVGAFKTDRRVYQYALDALALQSRQVLFASSNGWDAYAAADFGFRVAWINRNGQRPERLPGAPDVVLESLAGLPGVIAAG
ncbi:MAG: haloacid dehalogenase type II [Roseiarcus sp.]